MATSLPTLLQDPRVQELRRVLLELPPPARATVLREYFEPPLETPSSSWLEADAARYRRQVRERVYAIQEEEKT